MIIDLWTAKNEVWMEKEIEIFYGSGPEEWKSIMEDKTNLSQWNIVTLMK